MNIKSLWTSLSAREKNIIYYSLGALLVAFVIYKNFFAPPVGVFNEKIITIESGQTLSQVANVLKKENIIQSSGTFRNLVILLHGENKVMAGDYFFANPKNIFDVAKRISKGDFGLTPERITILEGFSNSEIAQIFSKRFPRFDEKRFLEIAEEGYMFPDTYFFLPNATTEDVVTKLRSTFDEKVAGIQDQINAFGKPLSDVIKMASIIEREAGEFEDKRIISGILWTRFDDNYPLQVDVTFKYINGKNTYNLTTKDLATTSPYNTYIHPGLPPTPIANPGLDSIIATISPVKTDYYFFLSDRSGTFYYSKTYAEHERKQNLYVR